MSDKLPAVKPKQLIRVLEKRGWRLDRVRGSHHLMKHPVERRTIPVPVHNPRHTVLPQLRLRPHRHRRTHPRENPDGLAAAARGSRCPGDSPLWRGRSYGPRAARSHGARRDASHPQVSIAALPPARGGSERAGTVAHRGQAARSSRAPGMSYRSRTDSAKAVKARACLNEARRRCPPRSVKPYCDSSFRLSSRARALAAVGPFGVTCSTRLVASR